MAQPMVLFIPAKSQVLKFTDLLALGHIYVYIHIHIYMYINIEMKFNEEKGAEWKIWTLLVCYLFNIRKLMIYLSHLTKLNRSLWVLL